MKVRKGSSSKSFRKGHLKPRVILVILGYGFFSGGKMPAIATIISSCIKQYNDGAPILNNRFWYSADDSQDHLGRYKQRANIVFISTVYSDADWMQDIAGGMLQGVLDVAPVLLRSSGTGH
ncbi:hypothetical protein ASV26_21135 [Klebsiella aerogenes]|nr:hypothetical protein KV34_04760 [Klebsiella aerogenes]KLE49057.1 hypothetical protein YA13_03260 [Klebsiella aerogenes]KTH39208.1 hypothetical protein ASV26_21135 [Klebsiella aerogenes]KZR52571.1 hypothetical protein A3N69_01310 [Klebsiella aerogenes]